MTIKSIEKKSSKKAVKTKYLGSAKLRALIEKLARKKLGEGEPLLKLLALLERAKLLTERRNNLTHGIWAKELDGDPGVMKEFGELQPLSPVKELASLSKEIEVLTNEFIAARLEGFLKNALETH